LNRRLTTVIVGAIAGLAVLLPAAARATFPGKNGMIVALFSNFGYGNDARAIFEGIQPNGHGRRIYWCTEFVGGCGDQIENPSISPDGKQLAFDGGIETDSYINQNEITLLRFGKFGLEVLPFASNSSSENDAAPSWVKGQNKVVFGVSSDDGSVDAGLESEGLNGKGAKLVVACGNCGQPAVSPNGLRMLYDNGSALWGAEIDGSNQTLVAADGSDGSWAPNGKRIAFVSGGSVYVSTPASGAPRLLAIKASDPVWSPNGRLIAYAVNGTTKGGGLVERLFTRPSGGGKAHRLFTETIKAGGSTFGGMDWQALP